MKNKQIVGFLTGLVLLTIPTKTYTSTVDNLTAGVTNEIVSIWNTKDTVSVVINDVDIVSHSIADYQVKDVPGNNSFKSFMDADCITDRTSEQYKLKSAYSLSDNGIYMVDGRYCIALGSYYATDIGTKIDLIMENGQTVECILAEQKDDSDTDTINQRHSDTSIVEFVVRESSLSKTVKNKGDCSYADDCLLGEINEIRVY